MVKGRGATELQRFLMFRRRLDLVEEPRGRIQVSPKLPPSPSKSKGSEPVRNRRQWFLRFGSLALLMHFLWYFFTVHSRVLRTTSPQTYLPDFYAIDRKSDHRKRSRLLPADSVSEDVLEYGSLWESLQSDSRQREEDMPWQELCDAAELSTSSHLVVVDALSRPFDTMDIVSNCRLTRVTLVDLMLPNTPTNRLRLMQNFVRPLVRSVQWFNLVVPRIGILQSSNNEWLRIPPTHIIVFERESSDVFFQSQASLRLFQSAHVRSIAKDLNMMKRWSPRLLLVGYHPQSLLEVFLKSVGAWNQLLLPKEVQRAPKEFVRAFMENGKRLSGWTVKRSDDATIAGATSEYPCPTVCSRGDSCEASSWDRVLTITRALTTNCTFVLYQVSLARDTNTIFGNSHEGSNQLCKIAFVSGQSPLVKKLTENTLLSEDAKELNGQLIVNGSSLVWLHDQDESTLSDDEYALPLIDPSKFFAPAVKKAMLVDIGEFSGEMNGPILKLLQRVDEPAFGPRRMKEYRPGSQIFRWIDVAPARAKRALLFAGSASDRVRNATSSEYASLAASYASLPEAQLTYYQLIENVTASETNRPETALDGTPFVRWFPYEWISLSVIVHDLGSLEAASLRCEWYDEYRYWGKSNRYAEELSLAFVLGRRKQMGLLGESSSDKSWFEVRGLDGDKVASLGDEELYIRILRR